jgi:hypothetical protein
MDDDVYSKRMEEKMLFVDDQMREAARDLTDEVFRFEKEAKEKNRKYSVRKLKFGEELGQNRRSKD